MMSGAVRSVPIGSWLWRYTCPALLAVGIAAPLALAQSTGQLDADTQAALGVLRDLTPQGQAAALAGIDESRREGELGQPQIALLAALVEEPAWTLPHRRQTAFLLALLGKGADAALDQLVAQGNGATQQAARDALKLHKLVAQTTSPEINERDAALQELANFAENHAESSTCVISALAGVYAGKNEPRIDIRIAALRALVRFGEGAAPALVESFANPDPFYYQHTKAALKSMRNGPRAALLAGLNHREPLVRQRVIYTFLELGIDEESAAAIKPLENDRDELVRKAAARAMSAWKLRQQPRVG
jgi:hypothetical protein